MSAASDSPSEGLPPCPTCSRAPPRDGPHLPFCSTRCKMVDLGRWFDERYVVPGEDAVDLAGLEAAWPGAAEERSEGTEGREEDGQRR